MSDWSKLIVVTNRQLCEGDFLTRLRQLAACRPRAVILREKDLTESQYEELAAKVLAICRQAQVPCILHSFPAVARRLGAAALHLPLPQLRGINSPQADFLAPDPERIAVDDAADGPDDRAEGRKRRSLLAKTADDPRAGQAHGRGRKHQKQTGVEAEARLRKS